MFFRSIISVIIVALMLAVSECFEQKEILFLEMAALTIGYLIVDKHVWRFSRWQFVILMTLGATGATIVSVCSPFPFYIKLH